VTEAAVAGVAGSFAYNATMTLGAAALVRPLVAVDAALMRVPSVAMVGAPGIAAALAWRRQLLVRHAGILLVALYPGFVLAVVLR